MCDRRKVPTRVRRHKRPHLRITVRNSEYMETLLTLYGSSGTNLSCTYSYSLAGGTDRLNEQTLTGTHYSQ